MHCFDGTIDMMIDESDEGKRFGWTKKRWLSDPRVPGSPLDAGEHCDTGAGQGHIVNPYISRDAQGELLAFRAGLYLDDPLGAQWAQDIKDGKEVGLSIQYSNAFDARTGMIADTGCLRAALLPAG